MSQAIEAGIFNDLGSGSNVDVTIITKGNVEYIRSYKTPNERSMKEQSYKYPRGTTRIFCTKLDVLTKIVDRFDVTEGDAMDVSA